LAVEPSWPGELCRVYPQVFRAICWEDPQGIVFAFDVKVHGANAWTINSQIGSQQRSDGDCPCFIGSKFKRASNTVHTQFEPK
jgi:hypothetical protein